MRLPVQRLADHVEPVTTWNPMSGSSEHFTYVDLSAVDQDRKTIMGPRTVAKGEAPSRARQLVKSRDVLVSTVRPNLNGVAIVPAALDGATVSTGFCVLRPNKATLDPNYLFQWVKSPLFVDAMVRQATGASYPAVSDSIVLRSKLPLPELAEQRRIAAILDQAEALRTQRRATIVALDSLTRAIFRRTFGDLDSANASWGRVAFASFLASPLRNGISPSTDGVVPSKVLTLSAITGDAFDASAFKSGLFSTRLSEGHAVDARDFLICRGNGNVNLVGKGYFPEASMPDVVFPDTIIAAQIDPGLIAPEFLEQVWNSRVVRDQLVSVARTTNGTFKVNQNVLEAISVPSPPMYLQRRFSEAAESVAFLKQKHHASLAGLDALFASLQHRAFRGEL